MSESRAAVAGAIVTMGATHYAVDVRTGRHALVADEPAGAGGGDAGPSPFDLLLSSLGACTAITLRMYCERKQWPLGTIEVRLGYRWDGETPAIERVIALSGLDDEQRRRCGEIAEKTPVTRALKLGARIATEIR